MADTVKKSRIDNLQNENDENTHIYENLSINGVPSLNNASNSSKLFIEKEREHNLHLITSNGHSDSYKITLDCENTETEINLDENVNESSFNLQKSCLNTNDAELKTAKDRMFLSTDDTSCLLFTQTVTSPMLTPSEENIDFLKGFKRESISENTNSNESSQNEAVYNGANRIQEKESENVQIEDENTEDQVSTLLNVDDDANNSEQQPQFFEQIEICNDVHSEGHESDISNHVDVLNSEVTNVCSNIIVSTVTESHFVETTTEVRSTGETNGLKKKKSKKTKNQHEKENISVNETNLNEDSCYNDNITNLNETNFSEEDSCYNVNVKNLKSSFSKFDALQKKNILNSPQADLENTDASNCKRCGRPVFQMERVVAERCTWHRNCFRCVECSKQLLVDNFESHEGTLYCKSHFKALFQPKAAIEDELPSKPRKHELIIRENQPVELPPDVARASDKPDLGLEELHSLNVKERFQVFENVKDDSHSQLEKNMVKMERSASILSKLARFQAKGMDVGVNDESLEGIPIEGSSSEENEEEEGEDADLIRAKKVQKEKPFHFLQMSDVKSKWEQGNPHKRDDLREERKQEIQNIRSRLFLGKQGKMKEAYQQAVVESESGASLKKEVPVEIGDTRSIKDRFEKGEVINNEIKKESEDMSVFESGISKKSRSIFLELDAETTKPPRISPTSPVKLSTSVRNAREAYIAKQASEDTIRSFDRVDEITVRTSDIQDRFKFFETYKEPEQKRKEFRMTPPREGQIKSKTPDREVYVDPDIVRSDELIEDSVIAKTTHTTTKMLSKFRQMEEDLLKGQEPQGPKPLKRFTPPREPLRRESSSEQESGSDEEIDEVDNTRKIEQDLIEAQKAARAQKLRAKFERWEENEIKRENSVNVTSEGDRDEQQSQIESAKSLRAKFESLRETNNVQKQSNRVKVNRFVAPIVICKSCQNKVYPLEKITVHGLTFHKNCFRCNECNTILRMDSYSYNQGVLYCMTHFKRLFITKGNYDSAFGLEQHKDKWTTVTTMA